jgi:hypothetical protein
MTDHVKVNYFGKPVSLLRQPIELAGEIDPLNNTQRNVPCDTKICIPLLINYCIRSEKEHVYISFYENDSLIECTIKKCDIKFSIHC